MKNRVVTISREFGSGGRTIGRRLAEEREQSPEQRLQDKDKRRAAYHRFYTNMKWGHAQNYHICLDSGRLGIDTCVKILRQLY